MLQALDTLLLWLDGAMQRRATLRRKTESRRLNVENLNVEDST